MRILFIDASTKLKTVRDLQRRARGGMVTSLFRVSDYLSQRGHHVYVLSDIESEGQTPHGTNWIHEPYGQFDCIITNRGTGAGYPDIKGRSRILWTHDLPHSGFIPAPKTIRAFDCTVFMSRYAERVWRTFYKDIGRSSFIPNGVDKDVFYPGTKDHRYLIYASAPNRGLDKLPLIADAIDARVDQPVYCKAYSKLSVLHPNEGDDTFDYKSIDESIVDLRDPVPQKTLADQIRKAGLMLMPTGYPEICSNAVLQSLACGTPVITTGNLGATQEWVKHKKNGMLTKYLPNDYMVHTVEMVRNAVEVLENRKLHDKLIRGALRTKVYSWQEIGRKWEKLISRFC